MKHNISFLESLINKQVLIYQTDSNFKKGILRGVQSDYLILEAEEGLVYFQLKLIGSVLQDALNQEESGEYEKQLPLEKTFYSLLKSHIHFHLKINQVGNTSYSGLVLDVKKDFVLLETETDGKIFINIDHIRSATEIVREEVIFAEEEVMESPSGVTFIDDLTVEITEPPEEKKHTSCNNLKELCNELVYSTVEVRNSEGENIEGVLVEVNDDSISIVKDNNIYRVVIKHIRTIKKVKVDNAQKVNQPQEMSNEIQENDVTQEHPENNLNDKPEW